MTLQSRSLSHKEYVIFGDEKKDKVFGISIIKVNDFFTLNDVALVDKLRYNMLYVSQFVDADMDKLRSSELQFVMLTQWLRPSLRSALAQV
jgi:hypothetical protein